MIVVTFTKKLDAQPSSILFDVYLCYGLVINEVACKAKPMRRMGNATDEVIMYVRAEP